LIKFKAVGDMAMQYDPAHASLTWAGVRFLLRVVDAVDEVQEDRRHELLDGLCQLTRESASVVKVFVTSRNNNNILALLPGALTIGIQRDDNKADMELFVRHHVTRAVKSRRLLNGIISDELEEYLIQMLCAKAEEMYIEPLDY